MADTNYTQPGGVPSDFWAAALRASKATGADPYLIAAIGKHETAFGTLGAGRDGYSMGYGVWTVGEPSTKWKDVPGTFDVQTMAAAKQIAGYLGGISTSLTSVEEFGRNSWKASDPKWAEKVWNEYVNLNKNALDNDPVAKVYYDVKDTLSDFTPTKIAGKVTYMVVLILIAGVALFSVNKSFSTKG